ncbi:MAG: TIGR04283 family arsenosugar biosynthesis glycosyltransferase [Mariprofundaceae bacterium]
MSDCTIAVVVPVLNEAGEMAEHLPGLLGLQAGELLCVDGGSNDDTLAVLEAADIHCLSSEPGRARQMNAGAEEVTSDIILFLHMDTKISSSHLSDIESAMQAGDTVGGRFDVRLSGNHPMFRIIEWFINVRSRLSRISTGDQAMFVRRDVFEQMGGFADIPLMEDIEFSRRLKCRGRIACLRKPVVTSSRRWEKHGILKTIWLMWKLRFLYWRGIPADKLAGMYREAR